MARTTVAAVQSILGGHYDGETDLAPFLSAATALVDWVVSKDTDALLTSALAIEVESFLTAHFYEHSDQIAQTSSKGGASDTYQGQTGMVLSSTKYGQTAMMLDVSGLLAKRSKEAETGQRRVAKTLWVGTTDSDSLSYEERN